MPIRLEDPNVSGQQLIVLILSIAIAYTSATIQGQKINRMGVHKYVGRVKEYGRTQRRHKYSGRLGRMSISRLPTADGWNHRASCVAPGRRTSHAKLCFDRILPGIA